MRREAKTKKPALKISKRAKAQVLSMSGCGKTFNNDCGINAKNG
jgi:hypothetical protein